MISFVEDPETEKKVFDIVQKLGFSHVDTSRVRCFRSHGSGSRRVVARCYALSKIWQKALKTEAHYIIEVLSERFDKLSPEDQEKVLIHELLHVPKTFGGGFRHHDYVCRQNVDILYKKLNATRNV